MDEPLILNRYRLLERLATGGSAEVWRAHDEQLDRPVAVKRLHPHLLPDEASRKRLVAEARAAAALSHPVIAGVYDVDASGEWPALVMELVDGESLGARLDREGSLPPREAAAVVADLADALYHAHQRGVIHRDVKPGNVLLAADGRTRLVDFGIAHSLAASAERLTVTGTVIGTLPAMAPEQLTGGEITPRTDLYGLGVVLYQALTGRGPYASASPVALAEAQRSGPPPPDRVPPPLAAVVAGCLAYDPAMRPLHAGALATALREWLAGDPAASLALAPPPPPTPVDPSAVTQPMPAVPRTGPAPAAAPTAGPPPPARSSVVLPIAFVAALAALVLLTAAAISGMGGDPLVASEAPSPSPTPTATPVPEWLTKLLSDVEKECGAEVAADVAPQLAALTEQEAKEEAKRLIEACKDAREGEGGGGNGRGNGEGRGNGNGGDD